jgi:hypothetical protein
LGNINIQKLIKTYLSDDLEKGKIQKEIIEYPQILILKIN